MTFGTVLVKSWVQCLGFSFLLKKEQIRSVELLQLGLTERTARGFIPIAFTHTTMHEPFWSELPKLKHFVSSYLPELY